MRVLLTRALRAQIRPAAGVIDRRMNVPNATTRARFLGRGERAMARF